MHQVRRIDHWDDIPPTMEAGAILLRLHGRLAGDAKLGLARLAALHVPTVAVLSGVGGPAELAGLLSGSIAYVEEDGGLELGDTAGLLEFAVSWPLARQRAGSLLFVPSPLDAPDIIATGIAVPGPPGAAEATAAHLAADPTKILLVRALQIAARTSAGQSADHDANLARILRG